MTNNHIINEEIIKSNKEIQVMLNDDKQMKVIKLENRKIYTSDKYDTTIIEIKSNEDKINNFLELDEGIFNDNINIFNKSIYILQYPTSLNEQKAALSYGILKSLESNDNLKYYCCTNYGSSGSPVLKLSNNKVIGIHKGSSNKFNYNKGTFLKYPIMEYLNNINIIINNEINMTIKIDKDDINKDIYFLDNTDSKYYDKDGIQVEHHHDNLKELNESNTEIFINNLKMKYKKYFIPEKEGIYKIKLKFNINIKDCSFMFSDCYKLTEIDFTSFNTQNISDMSYMFNSCSITNLDLSNFDTQNVENMSHMFCYCGDLKTINLSFDTRNVKKMDYMFFDCLRLKNIDISSFNTKKVTNMEYMFSVCSDLKNIDLSSFDTQNVTNMSEPYVF